jgi:hypothetical protein
MYCHRPLEHWVVGPSPIRGVEFVRIFSLWILPSVIRGLAMGSSPFKALQDVEKEFIILHLTFMAAMGIGAVLFRNDISLLSRLSSASFWFIL